MRDDDEGAELGPPPSAPRRFDDAGRWIADERDSFALIGSVLARIERRLAWSFYVIVLSALLVSVAAWFIAGTWVDCHGR